MTTSLTPGTQAFAGAVVNVRRTPGYARKPANDVVGQIPFRVGLSIMNGPAQADGLLWWSVRCLLPGGITLEGWAAEKAPAGSALLLLIEPQRPRVRPHRRRGPSAFEPGEEVTVVGADAANVRRSPGFSGKSADDILGQLARGGSGAITGGPRKADALTWWQVVVGNDGSMFEGWIAVTSPDGRRVLVPTLPVFFGADALVLGRPFAGGFPMTQAWGRNATFYKQFTYDGVPLRGHNGLDFGVPVGSPMLAVDDAEVIRADFDPGGFGNFVLLDHLWGESIHAHLDRVDVRVGQLVNEGDQVGLSGNTGASTGPHLHFGIRIHPYDRKDGWGGFCDPAPFMDLPQADFAQGEEQAPSPFAAEMPGSPRP
jgi:murein DD-endopeptidase MepM/ murein hydrolase activator NlpD